MPIDFIPICHYGNNVINFLEKKSILIWKSDWHIPVVSPTPSSLGWVCHLVCHSHIPPQRPVLLARTPLEGPEAPPSWAPLHWKSTDQKKRRLTFLKEKWVWGMRRVCKTRMTLTSRHTAAWLETQSLASSGVSDCTAPTPSCPVGPPVKYRPRARWPPSSAPPLLHQSSPGTASRHLDAVRWTTNNHVNKDRWLWYRWIISTHIVRRGTP